MNAPTDDEIPDAAATSPLEGLSAVVTGSSSGIGRAIAVAFAAGGARVLTHCRDSVDGARETLKRCGERGAGVVVADIATAQGCSELVTASHEALEHVDIWVNNAGADVLTGEAADWPFERKLDALWQVDVRGTIALSRAVGERMRERGRGAIINIGWDQAASGMEGDSGELFATTKGAVAAFTRSLALTLAPEVRVNCLAPGWIRTAWGETASGDWQARVLRETPLARWGKPHDVARCAVFLASPQASFITAQTIAVNGGAVR